MADLFDMKVGGLGFHLTAHMIALAALFVACFAITGYITFRDNSVPQTAIDGEDTEYASLTVTGATDLQGAVTIGNLGTQTITTVAAAEALQVTFTVGDAVLTTAGSYKITVEYLSA